MNFQIWVGGGFVGVSIGAAIYQPTLILVRGAAFPNAAIGVVLLALGIPILVAGILNRILPKN